MITTMKENKVGYLERQSTGAKRVRKLLHILGCPTNHHLKQVLRQNIVMNCQVTIKDVDVAEKVYGPDVGLIKGKTTQKQPGRVFDNNIAIPKELIKKIKRSRCALI